MNIPSGQELLDEWERREALGQTKKEWAQEAGVNYNTLRRKVSDAYRDTDTERPADQKPPKSRDTVDGSYRKVTYVSPDVRTLDELIETCQIDTDVWHIYKWEANKWPGYAKLSEYDISWKDGKIAEGYKRADGKLTVAPLFQIKAWMVLREPVEITPALRPVRFDFAQPKAPERTTKAVTRIPLLPDAQIGFRRDLRTNNLDPFHDRAALDVALQIVEGGEWDGIGWLGDWLDWTEWTDKFAREPEFYFTTQPALIEGAWWLMQFRKAINGPAWMVDSNHEDRLNNYLQSHLLAAYGLKPGLGYTARPVLSVPYLLGLDELQIEWIDGYPEAEVWLNDELKFNHGNVARAKPGTTAAAVCNSTPVSVVFGHIHRIERATRTEYRRGMDRKIRAVSAGCLCRIDGVVPGHNKNQNWQQGLAIANYTNDDDVEIETIEINNGHVIYQGKSYIARDRTDEIEALFRIVRKNDTPTPAD